MIDKRKFLKLLGFSYLMFLVLPYRVLSSATKKVINPNLSKAQKNIMFNEGTERAFTSDLLKEDRKGFYHCANCEAKLFASNSKFDSGTGWPSFSEALPGAFKTKIDYSFGMKRVEYHCANCGAHHGHVFLYENKTPLFKKIETIAKEIYRADELIADTKIREQLKDFEEAGYGDLPICIAKTQYSFSTDPSLKGAPTGHALPLREIRLSSGAEFIVVVCGAIMTMPGLPKVPSADSIKLNKKGEIEGLF